MNRNIENRLYNIFGRVVMMLPGAYGFMVNKDSLIANTRKEPLRLLFVCKGNICRSCYAEERFKKLCAENGLISECMSAGLLTDLGKPANPQAIETAKQRGVDLSGHRTTPFEPRMVENVDYVIAMEPWQVREVKSRAAKYKSVRLLGIFGMRRNSNLVIQDPFGKNENEFTKCFDAIDGCLEELLCVLKNFQN